MTLKYESEILFDLMKRDGDDTPSDVLPYESELKEKYLHQVEGAYPKLQDYRSEWLNYNLNAHLPADFPVESVSNVTNATFENVVPYAYGSAILKGQTLVNCLNATSFKNYRNVIAFNLSALNMVKPSTSYLMYIIDETNKVNAFYISQSGNNTVIERTDGTKKKVTTTENIIIDNQVLYIYPKSNESFADGDENKINAMLIEYQDGMENWDIPYFEGMQSVKMPVLTTTGKNLFDKTTVKYNTTIQTYADGQEVTDNDYMVSDFIEVKPNTTYTSNYMGVILYYDENRKFIGALDNEVLPQNLTTPNNCKYIRIRCWERYNTIEKQREIVELEQLEENSVATTYEPYKSNILTVNEDVTLRGIGEVQDTLDCLTGELTQRIVEVTFDGSENWSKHSISTDDYFVGILWTPMENIKAGSNVVSDKLIGKNSTKENSVIYFSNRYPIITFHKDSLESMSIESFKKKLSELNPTIQCQLTTESIKTVDLTVTDQDGNTTSIIRPIEGTMNVSTSSQTLPPLLDMSVPIEATTQNLMSFTNILEEE